MHLITLPSFKTNDSSSLNDEIGFGHECYFHLSEQSKIHIGNCCPILNFLHFGQRGQPVLNFTVMSSAVL